MRLLYTCPNGTFRLTEDLNDDLRTIPYVILSHIWGSDSEEVTFDDIQTGKGKDKIGYAKLEFCAKRAKQDGTNHFWVDTCCINKASEPELSQAIRSMFRWYRDAVKCYVFLSNVSSNKRDRGNDVNGWEKSFRTSRWFTRGWTLQELLAPRVVEFFSMEHTLLGDRATLVQQIHEVTAIPIAVLLSSVNEHHRPIESFSIEDRFAWAKGRNTKRPEDKAYCLFGIFNVQLPILYGEGQENALRRLREEIPATVIQIDKVIRKAYDGDRTRVERLSGESLPLECCFINLALVKYAYDNDKGMLKDMPNGNKFSLKARLRVQAPSESSQVCLRNLFDARQRTDGIMARPSRILIWGRAGMGKTNLCKKMVYDFYNNGLWSDLYDRLIWIPLRRLKRTQSRNTVELLENEEFTFTLLGKGVSETLTSLVHDPRTLFLLDGLDEAFFALDSDSAAGNVLHDLLSHCNTIVTSRPHGTRILDRNTPDLVLETIGFSPEQIEDYLRLSGGSSMDEIRSFIEQHPLVRSLAAIPIQLDAICYTWSTRNFPRDTATMTTLYSAISHDLWKQSVLRLEKRRDGHLVTRAQLEYWPKPYLNKFLEAEMNFLRELAFYGLCQEVIEFTVDDIEILESFGPMPGSDLVHLLFLRLSDSSVRVEDRTFHFIHLTFQEFFAAQHFVSCWLSNRSVPSRNKLMDSGGLNRSAQLVTPEEFVRSEKYTDRYNIFWRFVCGLLVNGNDKQEFDRLLRVLESEPLDLVGITHQRLTIDCLAEFDTYIDLQYAVRKLENRYVRWASHQCRMGWEQSLIRDVQCSDRVAQKLLSTDETREYILEVLTHRATISPQLLGEVARTLNHELDHEMKSSVAEILGLHCKREQKGLIRLLFEGKQMARRDILQAWRFFRELQEPAIEKLVELLLDVDLDIRSKAIGVLLCQPILPGWVTEKVVGVLSDVNLRPPKVFEEMIEFRLPVQSLEILIGLLPTLPYHDRHTIVRILSHTASLPGIALKTLNYLLKDKDRETRYTAVSAPKHNKLPRNTTDALVELIEGADSDIADVAGQALRQQWSLSSWNVQTLLRLLQHSNWEVRYRSVNALSAEVARQPTVVDALIERLKDPDRRIRLAAAKVVGAQNDQSRVILKYFERELRCVGVDNRYAVPDAFLSYLNQSKGDVEALMELVDFPDESIQRAVAWNLARQNKLSNTAYEQAGKLLHTDIDRGIETVEDALWILTFHDKLPDWILCRIVELLRSSSSDVRQSAIAVLEEQVSLSCTVAMRPIDSLREESTDETALVDRYDLVDWMGSQPEIQSLIPMLDSEILQQLLEVWFGTGLVVCFLDRNDFHIGSEGQMRVVQLEPQQVETFRVEWQKARDALKLLSLPDL